ncbi:hypothetical protein FACS1894172_19760 [Spirochaetia bacterium]|nr:hypothetical protein FACS1894172_19760 [Spirochaetia bacterium]
MNTSNCMKESGVRFCTGLVFRVAVIGLLCACTTVRPQAAGSGITFQIQSDPEGITITGHTGTGNMITIPAAINGKKVRAIAAYAFIGKDLVSVTLPETLAVIGESAFEDNRLTSIVIPQSVISIGCAAFSRNQIKSVRINARLQTIEPWVFAENAISELIIPETIINIRGFAFAKNRLAAVVLPGSVTSVGPGAFEQNPVNSVSIGENVTLAKGAFRPELLSRYSTAGKKAGTYTLHE